MTVAKVTDQEVAAVRARLPGWNRVEGRAAIAKRFQFAGFSAARGFLSRVALAAERQDHGPGVVRRLEPRRDHALDVRRLGGSRRAT
jgi:pterin-4a-carbinolamine dehydratase